MHQMCSIEQTCGQCVGNIYIYLATHDCENDVDDDAATAAAVAFISHSTYYILLFSCYSH